MLEAKHKMKLFFAVRPWEDEPDHAEWIDGELENLENPTSNMTGFKCRIVRNETTGTLCGYVGIPKENRFWGMDYDAEDDDLIAISREVHGGLTFASGEKGWWYFGFDTAHADDFAPKIVELLLSTNYEFKDNGLRFHNCMNYRTWEFVENEVHWLAWRLAKYDQYEKEGDDE
jgi:hypothetical protein